MGQQDKIEGQNYSIDYAYFDFRSINYIRKIELFQSNLPNDALKLIKPLSETDIQQMLQWVCIKSEEKLENMVGVQKLIDLVFANAQIYFKIMFCIFVIGFIIPFLILEFLGKDIWICMLLCTITITFIAIINLIKLVNMKWQYFRDFWNILDIIFILSWYANYIFKSQEGFKGIGDKGYTNTIIIMNFVRFDITIMTFIKTLNYMRTFESFASLIMLLTEVLKDLKYFMIFFAQYIICFATL